MTQNSPALPSPKWTAVCVWLFSIAGLILLMVVVGGLTRLTGSGLSITEWKPISGAIPPLNISQWLNEFEAYKQIPQFKHLNATMTLDEFKTIFWWEWGHRQLGRFIGFVFLVPMLWFFIKKQIPQGYKPVVFMLFLGGGLQGLIGWLMVKSGLVDRLHVSHYRLALHLGFALLLYYFVLHTAIRLYQRRFFSLPQLSPTVILTFLVFLQIISGAFTAGTHAGYTYNTYPLMDNKIIPDGLFSTGFMALFDDILTVQFIHRHFALVVFIMSVYVITLEIKKRNYYDAYLLFITITIQIALGIWTLVTVAAVSHIELAAFHQFFAVVTLSVCCYLNARFITESYQ